MDSLVIDVCWVTETDSGFDQYNYTNCAQCLRTSGKEAAPTADDRAGDG